jgi:hypothetical protein
LTGQELLDAMKRANLEKQRDDAERLDAMKRANLEKQDGDAERAVASSKQRDSLMRIGLNLEKGGKRDAALKWYAQIIRDHPDTPAAEAAAGRMKALNGK